MSREIESNYTDDYGVEEKQCQHCDSCETQNEKTICNDSKEEIQPTGHCDFFRSKD